MYHLMDIPDAEKVNYRTLHKDIGLIKKDNGQWDLWFERGDTVSATEFHSLQVGIIIACLTSWNYMNRYGNPTYRVFGNESYSLLKQNKSETVRFKIKAYFEECLLRMRRIQSVEKLEVFEVRDNPHKYLVKFGVRAMANYLITGEFEISTETGKSSSYIFYTYNQPYSSLENPLQIHLYLFTEYGMGLPNEIIYIYVNDKFVGIQGHTDDYGRISFSISPEEMDYDAKIRFEYHGNPLFNGCVSQELTFSEIPFHFGVDDDDMLYVTSPIDDINNYIWLGEIVDSFDDIPQEPSDWKKLYVVRDEMTAYKYVDGSLDAKFFDVHLKMPNEVGEYHLFIEDGKDLYMLDNFDNHVYYIGG